MFPLSWLSNIPPENPDPISMVVDRSFLFGIHDTQTGALLFVGQVANPVGYVDDEIAVELANSIYSIRASNCMYRRDRTDAKS